MVAASMAALASGAVGGVGVPAGAGAVLVGVGVPAGAGVLAGIGVLPGVGVPAGFGSRGGAGSGARQLCAQCYQHSAIKDAVAHAQRGGKILLDVAGSST
jgi:hypothetical protein